MEMRREDTIPEEDSDESDYELLEVEPVYSDEEVIKSLMQ